MRGRRQIRALVLYGTIDGAETLSYQAAWPETFAADERVDATLIDVGRRRGRIAAELALRSRRHDDAIVFLHSVFSNTSLVSPRLEAALAQARAPKAYFIGNESKLMPEKMAFAEAVGVSLLVTMKPSERVRELYRERLGCSVVTIPSGGVDTSVFFPARDLAERKIDLGFRGSGEPHYFGHQDRDEITRHFSGHAAEYGLRVDVSLAAEDRFAPREYADFLNRCRGQLGTEAGPDYFELTDDLRVRANAYVAEHPGAGLAELRPLFADRERIPARALTGRHAEAAATKTVQVLFRGEYNGFFEPDVHYLALDRDFANVRDVVDRLKADETCREVADRAYEVALAELTYPRLLGRFLDALEPLVEARAA
jgi:hypothetical protein